MPEQENQKLYAGREPRAVPTHITPCDVPYAELDVTTNYSFLRGATHPDELVFTAAEHGYRALAITDLNSVAGIARAHEAVSRMKLSQEDQKKFHMIIGTRLVFMDGTPDMLIWATTQDAYRDICRLLTIGRRRAKKGECHLQIADLVAHCNHVHAAIVIPTCTFRELQGFQKTVDDCADGLGDRLSIAISACYEHDNSEWLSRAADFSQRMSVPLLATNNVHYHDSNCRQLQDVLTCIRHGCRVEEAGHRLFPNGERYLKSPEQMHALFKDQPQAIHRALAVAKCCRFSLKDINYMYPDAVTPVGQDRSKYLKLLTRIGARRRYPKGVPHKVRKLISKELKLIYRSKYEPYFLTVYDIVRFANSQGILCQGRGSAANSAVCYCLGVTAVNPMKNTLVFSRFISGSRNEPPDIDVDFEHERREEVIQYVYNKYGRTHAAMTASLITYRGRSAIRDIGKTLGFSADTLDTMASKLDWWHKGVLSESQLAETGLDRADPNVVHLLALATELLGFPRHLSQHVGGMVISSTPLCDLVPIENASMEDRTVIEWDKDDLDIVGMFKVDLLALGMLTCVAKTLKLLNENSIHEQPWSSRGAQRRRTSGAQLRNPCNSASEVLCRCAPLDDRGCLTLPTILGELGEDPSVYDMISDADTIGVFQVESRAQMSMLPRLKPRELYDLVIEVAIVRPGPIQGDMVHPYLQQREARQRDPNHVIEYAKPELEEVLHKTLGVPLFQEQAMRMAIVAAGFSEQEADELRRGMAAWKISRGLGRFHDQFISGMIANGYQADFAEKCFNQIKGFGSYGFPESHAASFALLVYASAWLKRYHPAAFAAGLINSYPMGFYAPAQLVLDARAHGVSALSTDVNRSEWDCTLEHSGTAEHKGHASSSDKRTWGLNGPALRLGYRLIKGFRQDDADKIVAERHARGPFHSIEEFHRRTKLTGAAVRRLADADAFSSLDLSRRPATWHALAIGPEETPIINETRLLDEETPALLPKMPAGQEVLIDYQTTTLSLKRHPLAFVRGQFTKEKIITAAALRENADQYPHGMWVKVAGLVLVRQRPGTASGVVFMSIEDETGIANLILWSHVYERYRPAARHATLLVAEGFVQREGKVVHVLAKRLYDQSDRLSGLSQMSRDFH